MSLLLVTSIPYARGVWLEYQRFRDYTRATLQGPGVPWPGPAPTPEECVRAGIVWFASCPGLDDFCVDGLKEVIRRCMKSQDRTLYCTDLDRAWASTRFGYHACEKTIASQTDPALKDAFEAHCGLAYREVAHHCLHLETAKIKNRRLRSGRPPTRSFARWVRCKSVAGESTEDLVPRFPSIAQSSPATVPERTSPSSYSREHPRPDR